MEYLNFYVSYFFIILFSFLILVFIIYLIIKIFYNFFAKNIKLIFNFFIKKLKKNKKNKKEILEFEKKIIFWTNRIKNDNFLQLPFTILFLLILYVLLEYIGITKSILYGDLITQIDIRLSDFFYYFKDNRFIYFFLFISYFGNTIFISLLTIFISILLYINNKKIELIGFLTSIFFTIIISHISKITIERPRPEYAVYKEFSYSFPSFHATISVALYGMIFWFLYKNFKKYKNFFLIIFIFFAFLIGLSRLYLNVHFLSDVIAGWYLGALGLFFGITIIGALKHFFKIKNQKNFLAKKNKKINIILFLIFLILSTFYYTKYINNIVFLKQNNIEYKQISSLKELFTKHPNLKFTETITGRKTENINFIFIANSPEKIKKLFLSSNWNNADKLGRTSIKNMTKALIEKEKYKTAPITPLYYNKKIQNFNFQKLTNLQNIKYRHHIRIWKTNFKINNNFIFVGCGVYDNGLKWGITHRIDPNLDKEREYILGNLENNPLIKKIKIIKLTNKLSGKNFSGDKFFTDGKAYIIYLR